MVAALLPTLVQPMARKNMSKHRLFMSWLAKVQKE
jgi:hypothetical protein